jgi:hypothetical protein
VTLQFGLKQLRMLFAILGKIALISLSLYPMSSSKNARGYKDNEVSPTRRFRANMTDAFLSGFVSGKRSHSILVDGQLAGAKNVSDLAKPSQVKNCARDLLRRVSKRSSWPSLYWADVRTLQPKTGNIITVSLPFLLPHEIAHVLARDATDIAALLSHENLGKYSSDHLSKSCQQMGCDPSCVLPVALWGDGVPFNWDRSQSLDTWTMCLPGLDRKDENLRFPLIALPHHNVVKHSTMDDIATVLAWSFQCLTSGKFPACRHDGAPWTKADAKRSKQGGGPLGIRGLVVDIRGDWKFFKECFRLPQHNENSGICWLCSATPTTWKNAGPDAAWRKERLSHWDVLTRIIEKGDPVSPIFAIPFLDTKCFKIDWLHVADQGISANFLGSLFSVLIDKMPGSSKDDRLASLFADIQKFYKNTGCQSRLENLTHTMIRKNGSSTPKLRGRGADIRALVPYGLDAARRFLDSSDPLESTVEHMAVHLNECYKLLSREAFQHCALAANCQKLCNLALAMEVADPDIWGTKPKLHLFQELCEESDYCPSLSWCYRDEDMGGSLARIAHRKGGAFSAKATAVSLLKKWCARYPVPRIC